MRLPMWYAQDGLSFIYLFVNKITVAVLFRKHHRNLY